MPYILAGATSGPSASPSISAFLAKKTEFPCGSSLYPELAHSLELNPEAKISNEPFCGKLKTNRELLESHFIDEPDDGIDQDLPDSTDPDHQRRWMGGGVGPTSQGFRHMYFGGFQLSKPLATFQIPLSAAGQAPFRAELFGEEAKARLNSDKSLTHPEWGVRLLAWSMHYIQDLAQPFHAAQLPSLRMLPLSSLAQHFIGDTTRVITNYHWAFETYVQLRLEKKAPEFTHCLENPETTTTGAKLALPARANPEQIAREVARASIELAPEVGAACIDFFGTHLKDEDVVISKGKGVPDYEKLAVDPEKAEARARLEKVTCHALANAALGSRALMNWAIPADAAAPTP
jgi:hypothetical protein